MSEIQFSGLLKVRSPLIWTEVKNKMVSDPRSSWVVGTLKHWAAVGPVPIPALLPQFAASKRRVQNSLRIPRSFRSSTVSSPTHSKWHCVPNSVSRPWITYTPMRRSKFYKVTRVWSIYLRTRKSIEIGSNNNQQDWIGIGG